MQQAAPFERSAESIRFEEMWRHLPRRGLIPARDAFQPKLAKTFLSNIILAEVADSAISSIQIRVVGECVRQKVQGDMTGRNYFDFVQGWSRKAHAIERVQELFARPCGHWWVAPVHYRRGLSEHWEITTFPLAASSSRQARAILALIKPFHSIPLEHAKSGMISFDSPVQLVAIDIEPDSA